MLIPPGEMPGGKNLSENEDVIKYIQLFMEAPMVLKKADVVKDRALTSYPADKYRMMFEESNNVENIIVVVDGILITSRGQATVFPFIYKLAELLERNVKDVKEKVLYNRSSKVINK